MIKLKNKSQKILGKETMLLIIFFFAILFIFFLASAGKTNYDYFTRLASAFLEKRFWLTENPPWLNELIPDPKTNQLIGERRFFVAYPPMPAILAIPFVFLFPNFEQQLLAHLLGAGTAVLTVKLALLIHQNKKETEKEKKEKIKIAIWSGLFISLGTIIWFLSSDGSAWYLGQVTAAFFLTAALVETLKKKRPFLVGLFLGAAYLSRLQTILALPLFLFLLRKEKTLINFSKLGLGILPFLIFNFSYNYLRFGVIWDKGYVLIPGVLDEVWYQKGLFHYSYIPRHLKTMFWSFPKLIEEKPFIVPKWSGLAIWITSPAFVYALKAKIKEKQTQLAWLSIVLISTLIFCHGTTGFAQFGYRFAVDFYPILTFLTIKGIKEVKWHHWLLLIIGIIVNLWGVIWINKFGWVSY